MNNIMQLMQMAQGNPQQIIQMVMSNNQMMKNPMIKNAISMAQKNDTKGLQNMAENICRERGTTPQEIANNIKGQFGMK